MQVRTESNGRPPLYCTTQEEVDEMYRMLRKWGVDPGDEGRAKWVRDGGLFWIGRTDSEGRRHGTIVATNNTGGVLYQGRAFHGCPTGLWRQIAVGDGWVLSRHPKPAQGRTDAVTYVPYDKRGVQPPRQPGPVQMFILAEDLYYPSESELADMGTPEFAERDFTVKRVCYGLNGSISTYREEIVKGRSLDDGCGIPFLSGAPKRPHGRSYSFHAPGPNGEQGPLWNASWRVWPDISSFIETFDHSGRREDVIFGHCNRPVRCKVQHVGRESRVFRGDCDCQELEGGYGSRLFRSDIPDWALRPADPPAAVEWAKALPPPDDLYDIKVMPDGSKHFTCAEWHQD